MIAGDLHKSPGLFHLFAGFDIPSLVRLQARLRSAHPFLVWRPFDGPGRTWTYAQFSDEVSRIAHALSRRGVRQGDRIVIHLDNCPEAILAWFACAHIGAVAVATHARAAAPELAYFVTHSQAIGIITQPSLLHIVEAAATGLTWIIVTNTDADLVPDKRQYATSSDRFADLLRSAEGAAPRPPDPGMPIGVQYTSGTTSRSKGVVMTHANALWAAKIGASHIALREDDRYLIHLPLYHVIGLSYSLLATLWAGATAVLMPRFSASRFWQVAVDEWCTWSSMVPFCVRALGERDIPAVHHFRAWGNAFWSPTLEQRFRLSIVGWWGMTEIITHGIVGDPGKPGRAGAIGRCASEYQIAVRDDAGNPVEYGMKGDLFIRGIPGLSIFSEYLDDPATTEASFDPSGFFRTGDIVTMYPDGFIEFSDRAKDMLKVGGENVAASEVEAVIISVDGVREAAVVGRKDAMLGEVAVAFVRPSEPGHAGDHLRATILSQCTKNLANFKIPRAVHFVEDLPRGAIEKVSKVQLRELANRLALD